VGTPVDAVDPARGPRRWSKRLWAVVAFLVTGVLTAVISVVVTNLAERAQQRIGSPVEVAVVSDPTQVSAFGSEIRAVAVPTAGLTAPDPGAGCRELYRWARGRSGLDAGRSLLHVVVRGESDAEVVIEQIRAVIDRRQPSTDTTELACLPEGELEQRRLSIDLDAAHPVAQYTSGDGRPFGFTVRRGDVEAFLITAPVAGSSVWWHLEIDVIDGDRRSTVRVDDNGRPFATAPSAAGRRWQWASDGWIAKDVGAAAPVGTPTAAPVVPGHPLPPLSTS
jgi:hypothetical protein